MSHFSVFVLTELAHDDPRTNWENIVKNKLRPYQENNMDDCPKEFLAFTDKEDEYKQRYETEIQEWVELENGELVLPWDDRFQKPGALGFSSGTHEVPSHLATKEIPHKEKYPTFEQWMKVWCGYEKRDPEKNRYGYWENPNAKWDWWQIGGRWTAAYDETYDPETDPDNQETCWLCNGTGTRNDIVVANGCNGCGGKGITTKWPTSWKKKEDSDIFPLSKVLPSILNGSLHYPFAIITPDGKWNEKGEMGWWGIVSNENDDWQTQARQILEAHKHCTAIIVDCHI